ncbi:MAG TPA: hypothetical protein VN622_07900 [Clostridia bacterium]|nr:hypothetical protein [Clostridia bacterium]
MKRTIVLLVFMVVVSALAATAQTYGSSTSNQSSQPQTSQSQSTAGQTGAMGQAGTAQSNVLEGCVVQAERDYYIQPIGGGDRVKLSGGQDMSSHVGQHVRLEGTTQKGSSAGESSSAASTGAAGTTGAPSKAMTAFEVTRVDMISQTCPTSKAPQYPQ